MPSVDSPTLFVVFRAVVLVALWLGAARAMAQAPVGPAPPASEPPPPASGQAVQEVPLPPPKVVEPCKVCPLLRGGFATLDPTPAATQAYNLGRGYGFELALGARLYIVTLSMEGGWQSHGQVESRPFGDSVTDSVSVVFGSFMGGLRTPPIGLGSGVGVIAGLEGGYSWPYALGESARRDVNLKGGPFIEPLVCLVYARRLGLGVDWLGSMGAPGLGVGYRRFLSGDLNSMVMVTVGVY